MKKILLFTGLILTITLKGQNIDFARKHIDTLASESMHGRGYVNQGDHIAAGYLVDELQKLGIEKWEGSYRQPYSFSINTFPGEMKMSAGDKSMKAGYDFQVRPYSEGKKGSFDIVKLNPGHLKNHEKMQALRSRNLKGHLLLVDASKFDEKMRANLPQIVHVNFFGADGYIVLQDSEKLTWSVSGASQTNPHIVIDVLKSAWNDPDKVTLDVENKFINNYITANVYGYLPGTENPDSFVLITAHYDHLGRMGENTCYCGAHDNASGTAMALDLARHFADSANRPGHSLMFVFFSGEEAGLHGSIHFANHPPVDLDKVKFVMNIDLIGSGSKGIKVVNGSRLKPQFELLKKINDKNNYIAAVKKRGEAANSDHYPLYAKGVPAFFVYTLGDEYKEYHNPDDRAEGLPLTAYEGLFRLIRDYVEQI